jgi:lipopolysaccharide/colanic/teichoic acid biosynthesis glycosyltransferase
MMFKLDFDPRIIGNRIDENGKQVTGIGEFIRKYSLDEFPQFYNVLKGDMSIVGTRPPLPDEYEKYQSTQSKAGSQTGHHRPVASERKKQCPEL